VLLSSGLSPYAELDGAVEQLHDLGAVFAVLQCSSAYPCPPEDVGLNVLAELRERYGGEVGLSDHSGTIYPGLAAVALGASVLEVHVTLSREAFGPDVTSSLTTDELRQLVEGSRSIRTMLDHPVDKDRAAASRAELRTMFTRSLVARRPLPVGHVLGDDDLAAKKPGGGIDPSSRPAVVGRRLVRALAADEAVGPADVDPALDDGGGPA
jgi:N-acetylneuraminate synthase